MWLSYSENFCAPRRIFDAPLVGLYGRLVLPIKYVDIVLVVVYKYLHERSGNMNETLDLIIRIASVVGVVTLAGVGYSILILRNCHRILVDLNK